MMNISAATQRRLERAVHLVTGAAVLAYIYLPAAGPSHDAIRLLLLPALVMSGMAMWQAPRIRRIARALRERRATRVPSH
jgi:hypothetical protein